MTHTRTRAQPHTLTGTPAEVAAGVARLRRQADAIGQPLTMTVSDEAAGNVRARVVIGTPEPRPARAPTRRPAPPAELSPRTRRNLLIGGGAAATAVIGGTVWLVILAFVWAADHLALVIGLAAVVLGGYALAVRATGCPGLHCLGCSGH